MAGVAILIAFIRALRGNANVTDVQVDRGGGDNRTAEHFSAPGDDSHPLPGDYVAVVDQAGTGRSSAVGYVDPKNAHKTAVGEKRIYGRDSSGTSAVELWLKNDGSAILSNANGFLMLNADGSFDINGVTIAANGGVTVPDSLVLNGKELDGHTHSQGPDSDGNTEQDTGGNQ